MSTGTMQLLEQIAEAFFIGSAGAATIFVILYGSRSAWWSTPLGRVILGFMTVIALILDLVVFFEYVWTPPVEMLLVLSVMLYGGLFGGLVSLTWLLIRAQNRRSNANRAHGSTDSSRS